jgi:hypothetical protein
MGNVGSMGNNKMTNRKWNVLFCGVLPILCFCLSGCSAPPRLFLFSPDAPFKDAARLVSYEPPGKPFDEIATIWSTYPLYFTLIKSSDGVVLYKESPRTTLGNIRLLKTGDVFISPGLECQLPEGTYTFAGDFAEGDRYGRSRRSASAASITVVLKKGYGYNFYMVDVSDGKWKIGFNESKMVSPDR